MNKPLLIILILIPTLAYPCQEAKDYAIENKVKCYEGAWWCTLMGCGESYYDEYGEYIIPEPCNTCYTDWSCTDGKTFQCETGSIFDGSDFFIGY